MLIGWVILGLIMVAGITIDVIIIKRTYKKIVSALVVDEKAMKIHPKRIRFIVSYFIFSATTAIPVYLVAWFLPFDKEFFYSMLFLFPILFIFLFFLAYPYYTVIILDSKINGATLWGWMWKRTEISVNEIDREKVLQRNFLRSLGITMFKSADGTKILTLGLDDSQIKQIVEYAGKGDRQ